MLSTTLKLATLSSLAQITLGREASLREHSPKEIEIFRNFTSWYDTVHDETNNHVLKGSTNWDIPEWLDGIYISSGPSVQEFADYEFNHYFDGFGRFSSFNI